MQRERINQQIVALGEQPQTTSSLAIYFGGTPVFGSRGIEAEFAGKALEDFQNFVSNEYAAEETGVIGRRGPVRERNNSGLMITEVARGSVGFILEESERNREMFASPLAPALQNVVQIIDGFTSSDNEIFENVVSDLEPRVLSAAKQFFQTIDNANASMRIVDETSEHSFGVLDIRRGRQRADQLDIEEQDGVEMEGQLLGLLPIHRRFEFRISATQEVISGKVARDVAKLVSDGAQQGLINPIQQPWRARFKVREVKSRNAEPKKYYTLTALIEQLQN